MGRHHGKGLVTPFSSQHTWFPFYSRANIMLTDFCLLLSFHVLMYLQFSLVPSNFQMQEPYTASYKNVGHDFFILKFIFYWVYSCYYIALIGDSNNCLCLYWFQVRERCKKEWTMFRVHMTNAEKAYYKEMGINPMIRLISQPGLLIKNIYKTYDLILA